MNILRYLQYIPLLAQLIAFIQDAERSFRQPGSGASKSAYVATLFKSLVSTTASLGLISQKTATALLGGTQAIIDVIVALMQDANGGQIPVTPSTPTPTPAPGPAALPQPPPVVPEPPQPPQPTTPETPTPPPAQPPPATEVGKYGSVHPYTIDASDEAQLPTNNELLSSLWGFLPGDKLRIVAQARMWYVRRPDFFGIEKPGSSFVRTIT